MYGIDGDFNLKVVSWSDDEWKILPGSGGSFPPGVAGNTLQASPMIDGQQVLWYEATMGGNVALGQWDGAAHQHM